MLWSWLSFAVALLPHGAAQYRAEREYFDSREAFDSAQQSRGTHTPLPQVWSGGRLITAPLFIIIGAQKGGTTNLRLHLLSHPLLTGQRWEVHYFDRYASAVVPGISSQERARALEEYSNKLVYGVRGHPNRNNLTALAEGSAFLLDTSPSYIFHHPAPYRLKNLLPHVRLVAILRDPVDRYFSQMGMDYCRNLKNVIRSNYNHVGGAAAYVARAEAAYKPYQKACNAAGAGANPQILEECHANATANVGPLMRGLYADQLERWFNIFGRDQVMVLSSTDLFADFEGTLARVTEFGGLPPHSYVYNPDRQVFDKDCPPRTLRSLAAVKARMQKLGDERILREFFRPHNERLFALLGRDLGWNDKLLEQASL